jgi:type IV fimbrial biogenesis protein FimT
LGSRPRDRARGAGERVVAAFPPLETRVHLRSTAGRKRLVFQPSGGNAGSNATFTLCDARGAGRAVQLVLANDGRVRDATPSPAVAAACVIPGG